MPRTLYGTALHGVVKSVNGGASWVTATEGLPPFSVWSLAVDPGAPATVLAATDQGVHRTTDGGATWQPSSAGLPGLAWPLVAHPRPEGSAIYASTDAGWYRSLDHGDSWHRLGDVPWGRQLKIDDTTAPATLYVNAVGAIYRSTDDGETWTAIHSGRSYADIAIDRTANPSTLYALVVEEYGASPLLRSSDGGQTWEEIDESSFFDVSNVQVCHSMWQSCAGYVLVADESTQPATLYVSLENDVAGVQKSTDRGTTWTKVLDRAHSWELYVDRPGAPTPGVLYSISMPNGGEIFVTKLNAAGSDIVFSTVLGGFSGDETAGVAVDADGGVYVGGWSTSLNLPTPNGLAMMPAGALPAAFLLAFGPTPTVPPEGCVSDCPVTLDLAVQTGSLQVTLPNVTGAGVTDVAPVDDETLANFQLSDNLGAWDVSTTATYRIRVSLDDGTARTVDFSLR